jgi:hypothetical protein
MTVVMFIPTAGATFFAASIDRVSVLAMPDASVARTLTVRAPADSVWVTVAPSASPNVPSPSRSHEYDTPRPSVDAVRETGRPSTGFDGDA